MARLRGMCCPKGDVLLHDFVDYLESRDVVFAIEGVDKQLLSFMTGENLIAAFLNTHMSEE